MPCGTARQKVISMGSKNVVHACVSTLQVTFLGDFFQFTKNVCVTKNSVIVSSGTEHTCIRKKYKCQLLITAQYSCSTRQNNTRISSVQTDAIITQKQSAVFSTTEKSVDQQSRHQCRAASFDGTDNLPIEYLGHTHAAVEPTQHPHILTTWCDFCCTTLPRCANVCHAAQCEHNFRLLVLGPPK